VYVEGYLHTYAWKNQLDQPHWRTELVAREMVVLDEHP
jgi:single-stranded DNA-binding protein